VVTTHLSFRSPPDQVWNLLRSDRMWTWYPFGSGVDYPSDERRVGTVRQMFVRAVFWRQEEEFLRWDEGDRYTFYARKAVLPVFGTWAEDYQITETSDGGTRLRWTVAFAPRYLGRLPLRWLTPLARPVFRANIAPMKRMLP
jgi:hypothetical protein